MTSEAHAAADALGKALNNRDPALLEQIYADDISIWHGATGATMGKSENIAVLSALIKITSNLEYVGISNGTTSKADLCSNIDLSAHSPTAASFPRSMRAL